MTLARKNKETIRQRVEPLAKKLKIEALLDKYPNQLSGGEKQRVALARGIVKDSDIFILDDPLVGLDFKLREQLFVDLRVMLSEIDGTFIYTTSDPLETLALADDVFVLDAGGIVDQGSVDQVYEEPSSLRALQLLGFPGANRCLEYWSDGVCRSAFGDFSVELVASADPALTREVTMAFRPEAVLFGNAARTPGTACASRLGNSFGRISGRKQFFILRRPASGMSDTGRTVPLLLSWRRFSRPVSQHGIVLIFETATGRRLGRGKDPHVGSAVGEN